MRAQHPFTADEVLTCVASAERYSAHVLAASMIAAAADRGLSLHEADSAHQTATNGVVALIQGREVVVGIFAFVALNAQNARRTQIAAGELAIYVAIGGVYVGALLASDRLRDNAKAILKRLQELGVRQTMMLTGDLDETAQHAASELGITRVRAECLPADKVAEVAVIAQRAVIMVGDGVNDAPVLAAADVGIAMGARGATAASESADAVIPVDDISRVALAVLLGLDTVRSAVQSIWLGIAISVVLMAVAAFGVIPATAGAIIQELGQQRHADHGVRTRGGAVTPTLTSAC